MVLDNPNEHEFHELHRPLLLTQIKHVFLLCPLPCTVVWEWVAEHPVRIL